MARDDNNVSNKEEKTLPKIDSERIMAKESVNQEPPDEPPILEEDEPAIDEPPDDGPIVEPGPGYFKLKAMLEAEEEAERKAAEPALTEQQKAEILPRKYGLTYENMVKYMILEEDLSGCYMGMDGSCRLPPRTAAIRALNLCLKGITADGKMEQPGRIRAYREIERAQYLLECSRSLDRANDPSKDPWLTGYPVDEGEFYAHFGKTRESLNIELSLPPGSPLAPNYRPPTSGESINKVLERLDRSCRLVKNPRAEPWNEIPARHFRWGINRCTYIMHSLYNRAFGGFRWNDWSNFEVDRPYFAVEDGDEWIRVI